MPGRVGGGALGPAQALVEGAEDDAHADEHSHRHERGRVVLDELLRGRTKNHHTRTADNAVVLRPARRPASAAAEKTAG